MANSSEHDDMEDLTAQLESALEKYTGQDSFDLGGDDDFVPGGGLDRFRALDDGHDDDDDDDDNPYDLGPARFNSKEPSGSMGGVDGGSGMGPLGGMSVAPAPPPSMPSADGAAGAYVSYGQLMPPSYEDSVMYESISTGPPVVEEASAEASKTTPTSSSLPPAKASAGPGPSMEKSPLSPSASASGIATSRTQPLLHITVQDPIKREGTGIFGMAGGYVTYQITTRTQLEGFKPQATVRRRFNDFVALADLVKFKFRGYFVPPRPQKNAVEGQRMADEFVEERRHALQLYLGRLACHPKIAKSEEFRLFLETEGELSENISWRSLAPLPQGGLIDGTAKLSKQLFGLENRVLDPVQASRPASSASDPLRAMKEKAQKLQQSAALALSGEEIEMRREKDHLEATRVTLLTASRAAEKFVHTLERCSAAQGDLGLTLFRLAKLEEVDGAHLAQYTGTAKSSYAMTTDLKSVGTSLVRASRISRKATGRAATQLATLHEYLAFMPATIKGMSHREQQLLTAHTLQADLEANHRVIRDLEAKGTAATTKAKKVGDLQNENAKLEMSIVAANAEYDRLKNINKEELVRFKKELDGDLVDMMMRFSALQASSNELVLEVWMHQAQMMGAAPEELGPIRLRS